MKKILALIKYFDSSVKDMGNSKVKVKNKYLEKLLMLFGIFVIAIVTLSYAENPIENLVKQGIDAKGIYKLLSSWYMYVVIGLTFFTVFFISVAYALRNFNTDVINTFPVSRFQMQVARNFSTIKTTVTTLWVIAITLLLIVFSKTKAFDFTFLAVSLIIPTFIILPIAVFTEFITKIIVFLISKIVPKKHIEITFSVLALIIFYVIYGITISEGVDKVINMPVIKEIIEFVKYFSDFWVKSYDISQIHNIFIGIIISTGIYFVFAGILSKLSVITDNMLSNEGNTTGIFTKKLTNIEKINKAKKQIEQTKILSTKKAFLKREMDSIFKSPLLVFEVIVPTLLVPILMVLFGFLGYKSSMNQDIKKAEHFEMYNITTQKRETVNILELFNESNFKNLQIEKAEAIKKQEIKKDIKSEEEEAKEFARILGFEELTKKYKSQDVKEAFTSYTRIKKEEQAGEEIKKALKNGIPEELFKLENQMGIKVLTFAIIALFVYVAMLESTSLICISKDKNDIRFLKTIPIEFTKQFEYKLLFSRILMMIVMTIYVIPIALLCRNAFKISYLPYLAIIFGIIHIHNIININGVLDLLFPNLQWKTQMEITRKSKSAWMSALLKLLQIALYIYIIIKLNNAFKLEKLEVILPIYISLELAITVLVYLFKKFKLDNFYMKVG